MTAAVGTTRKTRILDSCRSGGFQAGWLAGRLAGQESSRLDGRMVDGGHRIVGGGGMGGGWRMENGGLVFGWVGGFWLAGRSLALEG